MKTKKIFALLMGVLLLMTVAGCGNGKKEEKKVDKQQVAIQNGENVPVENPLEEEVAKEETEVPEPEVEVKEPEKEEKPIEKVTMYAKSDVNVRKGAGASTARIGGLTKGQQVVKIAEENGWSKIEFNGAVGYVSSTYLSTDKVSTGSVNSNTSNSNTSNSNTSNGNTGNVASSIPTHEHEWEAVEKRRYTVIENYINGCNGCGYPLFTVTENGAQHIENLYVHPPCYSERLGSDCTGGGFHSESYTSGYCGLCGGKVSYRQCMWTENGKRCIKNEAAGAYEKVEFDQNYFMYFDSCDCGRNLIFADGIVFDYEVCKICGITKKPYE